MAVYENLVDFILPFNADLTREKAAYYIKHHHGNSNADTFHLYGGVGDPVLWLSMLCAYKNISKKPITLIIPQGTEAIPLMYKNRSYDRLLTAENFIDNNQFIAKECNLNSNERIAHHMYYGDANFLNYTGLSCASGLTNLEMIKSLLGLSLVTKPVPPLPVSNSIKEAKKLFKSMNLTRGKTVLIAPFAKSYPHKLSENWWSLVVSKLLNEGFKVVNNIASGVSFSSKDIRDNVDFIEGSIPLVIPIGLVIPFAELCGSFIGVRSGLCDLLAFSNTNKIIIYPQPNPDQKDYDWIRSVAHYWSLKRNYHSDRVKEYLVGDLDEFDVKIVQNLIRGL